MNFKDHDLVRYDNGYDTPTVAKIQIIMGVPHLLFGGSKMYMPIHLYDTDNLTLLAARDTIKQEIKQ